MTLYWYFTTINRFSNQIFATVKGSRWGGRARTTPAPAVGFKALNAKGSVLPHRVVFKVLIAASGQPFL